MIERGNRTVERTKKMDKATADGPAFLPFPRVYFPSDLIGRWVQRV